MADFIENITTKSAVRKFTNPIESPAEFNNVTGWIHPGDPWRTGVPIGECVKLNYSGTIVWKSGEGKSTGSVIVNSSGISARARHTAVIPQIIGNVILQAMFEGTGTHDEATDKYSAAFKCQHSTGEKYTITFTREQMRVNYRNDEILTMLEAWTDGIPALA